MKVSVKVPATTANLGPGFDCLGLALPIYNTITVEETIMPGTGVEINIIDETNEQDIISIPTDENNIVYKAIELLYNSIGQTPDELKITINTHIPIARGLGSSAAVAVGGLLAANKLLGSPADEAALFILSKLKKSPEGLLEFMKKIQHQNMLSGIEESSYFRTHPITAERVAFLSDAAKKTPFVPNDALSKRFDMIKAKLVAFLYPPETVRKLYPLNASSQAALYAHAILNLREFKINEALHDVNTLIEQNPDNPFFWELKGQIYFESGQVHNARIAYQKAYNLLPNASAFQLNLAQAMLEDSPSPKEINTIISLLNKSLIKSKNAYAWLMLAQAYGMQDNMAYANYASAEFSLFLGEIDTAEKQVREAQKQNPPATLEKKLNDIDQRIKQLQKKRASF